MKIIINGNIVDTELIYIITDIESKIDGISPYTVHYFIIKFLNGGELKVENRIFKSDFNLRSIGDYGEFKSLSEEKRAEFIKSLPSYQKSLDEITQFKNEIADIWSNHQGHIPKFYLEKELS